MKNRITTQSSTLIYVDHSGETWAFGYGNTDSQTRDLMRLFGRIAADEAVKFNWIDAAKCNAMVKDGIRKRECRDGSQQSL